MHTYIGKHNAPQRNKSTGSNKSRRTNVIINNEMQISPGFSQMKKNVMSSVSFRDTNSEQIKFSAVPYGNYENSLDKKEENSALTPLIQAEFVVSNPEDQSEQEADRVSEAVMNMDQQETTNMKTDISTERRNSSINRQADEKENETSIQPKQLPSGSGTASAISRNSLNSTGSGQTLSRSTRNFMESRFGYDFSSVRIHSDNNASKLARSINAAAFTHGRHIYFGSGRFDQNSRTGRKLLAHELTHVVQQSGGDNSGSTVNKHRLLQRRPAIHAAQGKKTPLLWRTVEAHVNLRVPQRVRIYNSSGSHQDFETSAGTGTRTSRLIRSTPYPILDKRVPPTAKVGQWGLQYFTWFTRGGIGFHSNICYPLPSRARTVLTVDGSPHSHGCMRLHDADSQTVYNALSIGDSVYIYNRSAFRSPSWGSSSGSTSGGPSGSGTTSGQQYVVVAGDTLSGIASRFGVSVDDIVRANGITDPDSIRPGQELTIPGRSGE